MRQPVLFLALVLFASLGWASQPQPIIKKYIPSVYTVIKGDTLWDISKHFLANPWLWPRLWEANSYIKNPHLIYPGDKLHLVWVDGQPRLRVKKSVKLSPSIRIKRSPITTLQESLMLPYLAEHKLLTPSKLERLPRILGDSSNKGYMSPSDAVWVDSTLVQGEKWWVYRPDTEFSRTQETDEGEQKMRVLALKEIARVKVTESQDDISRVIIGQLREEIRQNDVLLPAPLPGAEMDLSFAPSPPPAGLEAKVLGHLEGHNYIATSQVVVIDRGHLDQLSAGNILQLYRSGAVVKGSKGDYRYKDRSGSLFSNQFQLSDVAIGELMVLRPYEHFSLAVVTRASEPFCSGVLALPPRTTL
ncbi:LysM peptidoglycan-binding domain-containing protein [uncultured Photobacterium sp.]|uniref:LysM peptidoglycan-binding domain-containing protein n=1 Tax=uncultured Photobacterium sp. TaxID=173973 RepID=UPI00261D775B|nr:LysM peptidoglycan-binding domain-containing protein [uncultured Photobacterium sp.]